MITLGTVVYNEAASAFVTVKALARQADRELKGIPYEILCVDNTKGGDPNFQLDGANRGKIRVIKYDGKVGTACAKQKFVEEAKYDLISYTDSHVVLSDGSLKNIFQFFQRKENESALLHGVYLHNNGEVMATEMNYDFGGFGIGTWVKKVRLESKPFEIRASGMGQFAVRKSFWCDFHPDFIGFAPEEFWLPCCRARQTPGD